MRRQSAVPIRLGLLVDRGALPLYKFLRASGHPSWAPSFPPLSEGTDHGGVYRQHHNSLFCQEIGGDVFRGTQPGDATPPSVDRIFRSDSGSPIYRRVSKCSGRLPKPSSAGPQFQMDLGLGGRGLIGSEVAGKRRHFRRSSQLPTPGLLFVPQQSHGSRHRRVSAGVGWPTGVRVSTFRSHSPGHQQAEVVQGDFSDANRSVLASERMFSRAPESRSGSSVAPAVTLRLTQTAPLSSPAPEPPSAEPSCVATIQRFACHLGLS